MYKLIIIINPGSSTKEQLKNVKNRIKEYSFWAKLSNTSYLICTNDKAPAVRDSIYNWLNSDSSVYVFHFNSGYATRSPENINNWLINNFI